MKKSYKNNKFKILDIQNKIQNKANSKYSKFELPDDLCSVSGIQYYFEYLQKNMKKWLIITQ